MSNFVEIGQTAAEIWQFFDYFKMAVAAILNLQNLKFLTVGCVTSVELRHCAKLCRNQLNRSQDIAIFQDGGRRHLGFLNF